MGVAASAPDDVLERASGWLAEKDVLCLRALSQRGRDVAGRAIARKAIPDIREVTFERVEKNNWDEREMRAPARAVAAMGQVFGAGCVNLQACGVSSEKLAALYSFVVTTRGGLLELNLWQASVSSNFLVEMCRLAPNIVRLRGPTYVDTTLDAIQQISRLCPKLEAVEFATKWKSLSPAEEWERYFPNLRSLKLGRRQKRYRPTALHAISEAARTTSAVEIDIDACHIFPDVVEAIVGTPLGDRITTFGCGMTANFTSIDPEAILAAARGFPRLTEIGIPEETPLPAPSWFAELARECRSLTSLIIGADNTTNAHVAAAFAHNQLQWLELSVLPDLTFGLGDAVVGTQTAAVLRKLVIDYCDQFRAADVLSLVRACPKLTELEWRRSDPSEWSDWDSDEEDANEVEINELIEEERGGTFYWVCL